MQTGKAEVLKTVSTELKTNPLLPVNNGHDAICFHTQLELVCTSPRAGPRFPEDSRRPLGSGLVSPKPWVILPSCPLPRGLFLHLFPCCLLCLLHPRASRCWEPNVITNELPKALTSCSSLSPGGEKQPWPGAGTLRVSNERTGKYFSLIRIPNELLTTVSRERPDSSFFLPALHTSPCSQAELQAGKGSLPAVKTIKTNTKGPQTPRPSLFYPSSPSPRRLPPSYSFFPCTLISATY